MEEATEKESLKTKGERNSLKPAWFAAVIVLILFLNTAFLLYFCFVIDLNKNMDEISMSMGQIYNAVRETDLIRNEIIDDYDRHAESHLRFVRKMTELGIAEEDAEKIRNYIGLNNFAILNRNGEVLSFAGDIPNMKDLCPMPADLGKESPEFAVLDENGEHYCIARIGPDRYGVILRNSEDIDRMFDSTYGTQNILDNLYHDGVIALIAENGTVTHVPEGSALQSGRPVETLFRRPLSFHQMDALYQYWAVGMMDRRPYLITRYETEGTADGKVIYYCEDILSLMRPAINTAILLCFIEAMIFFVSVFYLYHLHREYDPKDPKKLTDLHYKTVITASVSVVLIIIAAFYARTLSCLSSYVMNDREELLKIRGLYEQNQKNISSIRSSFYSFYETDSRLIAKFLSDYPEYRTEDHFRDLSGMFGLDYIVQYDAEGQEVLTDGGYVNLSLSTRSEDPSHAFRPILNGVETVVQDPMTDDLTGLYHQVIGVILRTFDKAPDGLIQCAWPLDEMDRLIAKEDKNNILNEAVMTIYNTYFVVDPATGLIEYSPFREYNGCRAADYGFTPESLAAGYSGYLDIDNIRYFTSNALINEKLVFIAVSEKIIFGSRFLFTAAVAVMTVIDYLILLFLLQKVKYRQETVNEDTQRRESEEKRGVYKTTEMPTLQRSVLKARWNERTPEGKTGRLIRFLSRQFLFLLGLLILFRIPVFGQNSILTYIMKREWKPGFNIFAMTYIMIMIILITVFVNVLREILTLFARVLSPRAGTICRLLKSFLEYVSVIVTVYAALGMLGFEMSTLLASAGILTLVVGLGANDLIADVIAGLFLIFEGEFQVGDVIEINGKSGTVKEIGIRSVKLLDNENNLIILNNSEISNLINKTLHTSFAEVKFRVPGTVMIQDLEELFKAELPHVKEEIEGLEAVPFFKGVTDVSSLGMTCVILAEVSESRKEAVQPLLYGAVIRILREHGISVC